MRDYYFNIAQSSEGQYKEKGSSFIAYAIPLVDEKSIKQLLDQIRKQHPKSRHVCFAYRFGQDPSYHRINDDGEPSGTAGKPILGQLIKYDLENTLITVVRYFGGTLLGTSGLITAYKMAAENAISNATIQKINRYVYYKITFGYTSQKIVEAFIQKQNGLIQGKTFAQNIVYRVGFPLSMHKNIEILFIKYIEESNCKEQIDITFHSKDTL